MTDPAHLPSAEERFIKQNGLWNLIIWFPLTIVPLEWLQAWNIMADPLWNAVFISTLDTAQVPK